MMESGGSNLGDGWPQWMDDGRDGPMIPARFRKLPPDCPFEEVPVVSKIEAKRMAWRFFWRGWFLGGAVMLAGALAARADGLDVSGTVIRLEPSADPAAFADVVMHNAPLNGPRDTGAYVLAQDGIVVGVSFTWDADFVGADRVVITPPVGMVCVPSDCTLTVIEGLAGRMTLLPYAGF